MKPSLPPVPASCRPFWGVFLFWAALICSAGANPPDLTNGGTPTTSKNLNLGPTGLHGWLYHVRTDSSQSRQILVTSVEAGSPGDGLLAVGDVILGADGTGAEPADFSSDARRSLAQAIADAEASNPAVLKLLRWRSGVITTVSLTLQSLGSYSATAPYNCPKSALILEQGLDHLIANEDAGRYSWGTLSLLAANDPSNPDNAARQARAQAEAHALIAGAEQIAFWKSGQIDTTSKVTWSIGHRLIVLSEYYLQTGDPLVLPTIEAMAVQIANGQSHFGTMGHQLAVPAADGSLNGAYNWGYGTVNSAGEPCFLGLLLARECGVVAPEIAPAIERASAFYAAYAGYGTIPYGEHEPYRKAHESNGKSGLSALCFELEGTRASEQEFFGRMATAAASERENGHTGAYFNQLWAPLGAASVGEEAAAAHFRGISWMLDLNRRWDGGFEWNTLNEGGDGGVPQWNEFWMSSVALLTYALPLRQLHVTGRGHDPARWLTTTEVNEAIFSDTYEAAARTTSELVSDLADWSPKVQESAATELGLRISEHATLIPQLIAIANDSQAGGARVGACLALGKIKDGAAAATLADLLDDPDPEVRYASAEALRFLPQADKLAQVNTILAAAASTSKPVFPLDAEDPLHFAHHRLCMLLFYSGNAYGPRGVIWGSGLTGIDRNLLYPAIEAVAANPNGQARSTLAETYRNLTQADVEAVSGTILDSVTVRAPADKMFSGGVRTGGMDILQAYNLAEGVSASAIVAADKFNNERAHALDVLALYAGSSTLVNPDPGVVELCEFLAFTHPTLNVDAQEVLDAIAADLTPVAPTPLKNIQATTADNASLTLPAKYTTLHVAATDLAQGDTIYTWRKVHGAGQVTFTPNASGAAADTTVVFDGVPGQYLFEVTMSDSRGLTEEVDTVPVTLYETGGGLPPNDPPTATAQNLVIPQSTTTSIVLSGVDPEGHALNFSVTSEPIHGSLSGTAPYLTYTSDFGYTGADSFTFEVMDSEGQTASATISITVDPIAGLETAVYEPFDYPAGLLGGQSGSSEVGLDGTWAANGITSNVTAGSLTYSSLTSVGGKFETTSASNHFGGARAISTSALAANGLLNDGATLWFSALVGYGPGANGTNARLALALANDSFNTGNYNYWINDDGAQLGSGVGFTMGRHDGANGRVKATQFQDLSQGDGFAGNIYGTWEGTGATYGVGEHGFIVGRITWSADPELEDIIEIFQPLTDLELPGAPISVLKVVLDQSTFDTLTFCRGDHIVLDEIRLGPNYHSVLVGNQPLSADTTPPTPDPVGFHTPPFALNGTSIHMEAATAYDSSGVEYYFTCTAGGGTDSGWQSSTSYTDSGLTPGVEYRYTVTARDLSPGQNATAPSVEASATTPTTLNVPTVVGMEQATAEAVIVTYSFVVGTVGSTYDAVVPAGKVISQSPAGETSAAVGSAVDLVVSLGPDPDQTPPTPDPMSFAVDPYATGTTSMAMTATTASDPAGVEYYFTCTNGGGNDSGWQDSPDYEDTGLEPDTTYGYTVTARDKSANENLTAPSASFFATTDPVAGSAPTVIPITSFDPNTFFGSGVTAGIDFDVDSGSGFVTQPGFLSVPADGNKSYNVTHNGITFDLQTSNANLSNQARWRNNALAGDLMNDFQQFFGRFATPGNGVTATLTLTGLAADTDYEVSFFTYNVGAGQTTHNFHHGATTSDPLITSFTTAGNQNDYGTWVPGITLGINSGAASTITITVHAPESLSGSNYDSRLTLDGISVVDTTGGPVNSAPMWVTDPVYEVDATEDAAYAATLADDASDPNGDPLTFAKVSGPAWLSVADDGSLSGTPGSADVGANAFTVSVSDSLAAPVNVTLEITVLNAPDILPPSPDPMAFAVAPSPTGTTSIAMTATTASDPSGVEYYFTCTAGGGNDSGWQDSPVYEDTGLSPGRSHTYTVKARDKSANQNETASSPPASATTDLADVIDHADADLAVVGSVVGSYLATQASDNAYQTITEDESKGKPADRYSYLEHKWSFNVAGGASVIFRVEAHHSANSEGDDFVFAYSTTGADGSYTDMLTVTKTADDDAAQSFSLPPGTSGVVHVRVRDTDQTPGNRGFDALTIDEMSILSSAAAAALRVESDDLIWETAYLGTNLADPESDFDGDGTTDWEEYVWGLDPTDAGSSRPGVFPWDPVTGTFAYQRRPTTLTGARFSIWTSPDLRTWTEDVGAGQVAGAAADGVETVVVTPTTGGDGRALFVRVKATR